MLLGVIGPPRVAKVYNSTNGPRKAGLIMPKAYGYLLPQIQRLRLYKSEFTIFPPGYRTLFRNDDFVSYIETETSRGGAGIAAVGCAVEGTREARTLDY